MSYILDALKKSDRERQEEASPHLQHLYAQPTSRDAGILRRYRWPWFLLFGLLLSGGLVQWVGWNNRIDGRQVPEEIRQSTPGPTEMAAPQEPASRAFPESEVGVAESDAPPSPIKVQTEWFDDWFQHLPKKDYSSPAEVAGDDLAPVASIPARPSKKVPIPVKIKKDREKIVLAPQEETTVIRQPEPVPPVVREPRPPSLAIGQSQQVPTEKPRSVLPYVQDLPPQVQAEIPKLQFAGHAYALAPSQRLIVINGMIMREGDHIDAETRLAEITWEGVVIDRKGVRFQVKCY